MFAKGRQDHLDIILFRIFSFKDGRTDDKDYVQRIEVETVLIFSLIMFISCLSFNFQSKRILRCLLSHIRHIIFPPIGINYIIRT